MNIEPLQAILLYVTISLACAVPLRVAGTTWTYAISRGAAVPLVVTFFWCFAALTLAMG